MRRRLAIAIVGLVVAALFLAGIGTIVLASVADRQDAEDDLREQVEAIGDLLTELTFAPTPGREDETIRVPATSPDVIAVGASLARATVSRVAGPGMNTNPRTMST